jgi:O-antigen ligase
MTTTRLAAFGSLSAGGKVEVFLTLLLCAVPVGLVTVRAWSSAILILGSIGCCAYLYVVQASQTADLQHSKWITIVKLTMIAPVVAATTSSLVTNTFSPPQVDAPIRFLVAVPIFIFCLRTRLDAAKCLSWTIPIALLITLGQQYLSSQPQLWGPDRMATFFADPLVFGYTALMFALVCFVTAAFDKQLSWQRRLFLVAGFAVGVYLSVKSGSRTGWFAIPLLIAYFTIALKSNHSTLQRVKAATISLILLFAVYELSGTVQSRIAIALHEISTYGAHGMAEETSVGLRITFLRLAWDLFLQQPWFGYGDLGIRPEQFPGAVKVYATDFAVKFASESGFHNEIVTNTIRSGVLGLTASTALFFVPLYVFHSQMQRSANAKTVRNARLGFVVVICFLASSLSTETFDLKYMASFYAVMLALLLGSALTDHD